MTGEITLHDLWALACSDKFIFERTGNLWPAAHVDKRFQPVHIGNGPEGKPLYQKPTTWLARNRCVEQISWVPGQLSIITDKAWTEGGLVTCGGHSLFNSYRAPPAPTGDPELAGKWLDHVELLYPNDHAHIISWLAFKAQNPGEKVNHALVIGGAPGVGKDTILEGAMDAFGAWNTKEVKPASLLSSFNSFLQCVFLRVNEVRDTGEVDRYQLYHMTKEWLVAPPSFLTINEKFVPAYKIANAVGIVFTTNYLRGGMYLPADDRRHYVAWTETTQADYGSAEDYEAYFADLFDWLDNHHGRQHVAAHLMQRDLTGFNPKAPPPKTPAFWAMVNEDRFSEDAQLLDALEALGQPVAVCKDSLLTKAQGAFADFLNEGKNGTRLSRRLEEAGYVAVDSDAHRGFWRMNGRRQVVWALKRLHITDRKRAAAALVERDGSNLELAAWAEVHGLQMGGHHEHR